MQSLVRNESVFRRPIISNVPMVPHTVNGVEALQLRSGNPKLPIVDGVGVTWAVVWPGIGTTKPSIIFVELGAGFSTIWLKRRGEAVYYLLAGAGTVLGNDTGDEWPEIEGSMVHIGPDSRHHFLSRAEGLTVFGGPCPADLATFEHLEGYPVAPEEQ